MGQLIAAIPAMYGTLLQGESAYGQSKTEALQLEQNAGQERASSQRSAIEQRRSARYMQARLRALAAASGAGASDPTVVNLDADIAAAGEYGALTAMYEGETRASGMEYGAKIARKEGKAARLAGYVGAASKAVSSYFGGAGGGGGSTLLSGASSWYEKYGGGGPASAFSGGTFSAPRLRGSVSAGTELSDYTRAGIYGPRYG